MNYPGVISENRLDVWVRGNSREAQVSIVDLVLRLVAAASPKPRYRRFPLEVNQHGPDGKLDAVIDYEPFVPLGKSYWEIGTGNNPRNKANQDYNDLTCSVPDDERRDAVFIFVTPLSGRTGWENSWAREAIASWEEERRRRNEWKNVRVLDGAMLIDWMRHLPSVERWMAKRMGIPADSFRTLDEHWEETRLIGNPPPLTNKLFVRGRDLAVTEVKKVFDGHTQQLRIDTHTRSQMVDLVSAIVNQEAPDKQIEFSGRALVISSPDAWEHVLNIGERMVLVADFDLEGPNADGARLLSKAQQKGHAVIYAGPPGGVFEANRVRLVRPGEHDIRESLLSAGYPEQRARNLAHRCAGDLDQLLRMLQTLSRLPEWGDHGHAANLKIAQLLGQWDESHEGDKQIVEDISGNEYREWIGEIRKTLQIPDTPLEQKDGKWKFSARYYGWHVLGEHLFDDDIERYARAAIEVLKERDPKFGLPPNERFAAPVYGKTRRYSGRLRHGLAETLALLGSESRPLTNVTFGKSTHIANKVVCELLNEADWFSWASINDVLPLLAEASPEEFLKAIESDLLKDPCPFLGVFEQEGDAFFGGNHLTGVLWGLESLAWSEKYLVRVTSILGRLAAIDPGGKWTNRPFNSMLTILLPWLPQTCAGIDKRKAAVNAVLLKNETIGWKLLLGLLPNSQTVSSGTYRPVWREFIPDDWNQEKDSDLYWKQTEIYARIAIQVGKNDFEKLQELVVRLPDLPSNAYKELLEYLRTLADNEQEPNRRKRLWEILIGMTSKHRRFSDTDWAMPEEQVTELDTIANAFEPKSALLGFQRLFSESDFDLYDQEEDFDKQIETLEEKRIEAAMKVFQEADGIEGVLAFARDVAAPWRFGWALGKSEVNKIDEDIFPGMLIAEDDAVNRLIDGYVWGRFHKEGWEWVDGLGIDSWGSDEKGAFFTRLPFQKETWEQVKRYLGENENIYWSNVSVNPYDAQGRLTYAVERLLENGRPLEAIRCLGNVKRKEPFPYKLAISVLRAYLDNQKPIGALDHEAFKRVFHEIQKPEEAVPEDLYEVEWGYLKMMEEQYGPHPKYLERRLVESPDFFCEVIQTVFRPEGEDEETQREISESEKKVAENGYKLLHQWQNIPGQDPDGNVSAEKLWSWIERMEQIAGQTGHLGIAQDQTGKVLRYSPKDPSGLWIHKEVAKVLDRDDAGAMRDAYRVECFNSRGVELVTGGRKEREKAEVFRARADSVENEGFVNLAATLRDISRQYIRDAEYFEQRDPYER